MEILEIIIILVLIGSFGYTLYKKKYGSSAGIAIMIAVY